MYCWIFFSSSNITSNCHFNIGSRKNKTWISLNIWSKVDLFVDFFLLHLNASYWRNLCRFSLNTNQLVKLCPAFRIQSVKWTVKDSKCFLRDSFSNCWWLAGYLISSYWMESPNIFFFFSRFSLNLNWLVIIYPAYKIHSVNWTYQIGLSIQQETKKKGQKYWNKKGKGFMFAVGWKYT